MTLIEILSHGLVAGIALTAIVFTVKYLLDRRSSDQLVDKRIVRGNDKWIYKNIVDQRGVVTKGDLVAGDKNAD